MQKIQGAVDPQPSEERGDARVEQGAASYPADKGGTLPRGKVGPTPCRSEGARERRAVRRQGNRRGENVIEFAASWGGRVGTAPIGPRLKVRSPSHASKPYRRLNRSSITSAVGST
jgi:hypothetical protein